jgi:pyridoxine 5'-phosphate synthase PdxJ
MHSRKDTHHGKENDVDSLQKTCTRNKEKEGSAHPKVLHPLQVFRGNS